MKKSILFIIGVIVYRLLLDLIYFQQITPFFAYWLMVDNSTTESGVVSWIILSILTIPVLFFYNNEDDSRFTFNIFVLFIYFVKLVPFTSILYYQPQSTSYICQQVIMWMLLFILLFKSKPIIFNVIKKNVYVLGITAMVCLAVLIVSGVYAHFRIHLNLSDVYDLRFEARTFNMPTLLKYIYSFAANILPVCIVYYIIKKKYIFVYFLAFIGLLNFSIAGSKSTLFRIFLCLIFFFLKDMKYKKWVLPAFLVLVIASALEFILSGTTTISTLIVRRSLYIPNLLDSVYFDYMQNLNPFYFDTSKYTDLQFGIGADVFGNDQMRANNGFFTDAYINLGSFGCVVYPFIYALFIRLLAGACDKHATCIVVFSTFLAVTTLQSTFFTTSLLTHGLALMIVTLYVMPDTRSSNNNLDYNIS